MTLDTIQELLSRKPFDPFHIVTSSGDRYEVRHPEMVLRVKNGLYVGLGGRGAVADRAAFVSLLHVSAVETHANGARTRRR
ncbi:MAG TPA: hypothetical protein VKK61_00170 [Tepidisphaeraceae bacterium]|nr:hypothetical protein [Tepidisphaeraceae bacterium]